MKKKLLLAGALLALSLALLPVSGARADAAGKNYRITYQMNKGRNHRQNPKAVKEGRTVKLRKPSRKGYVFRGWYEKGRRVSKVKGTKNHALSAKWAKNPAAKRTKKPSARAELIPMEPVFLETTISMPGIDGLFVPDGTGFVPDFSGIVIPEGEDREVFPMGER